MGQCERLMRVEKPADEVWEWISRPENIFGVNLFHAEVKTDKVEVEAGDVIDIDHDFFGLAKQKRQAKVREVSKYFIAFGEYKVPDEPGRDPFPHNQSFRVVPVDDSSCIVVNRLTGRYIFPGSGLLGERLFRRYIPIILDDDNQMIAIGCGAMEPTKLHVPKALFFWPLMLFSARVVKKSTRRQMLEKMKAERAAVRTSSAADKPTAAETHDAADKVDEKVEA